MRPSFFISKLGNKVYLTGNIKLWYNGVGIIIYKKSYMILTLVPHIRDALAIIGLALG